MILYEFFTTKNFDTNVYVPLREIEMASLATRCNTHKLFLICAVLSDNFTRDVEYHGKKEIDAIYAIAKDIASKKSLQEILGDEFSPGLVYKLHDEFVNCCEEYLIEVSAAIDKDAEQKATITTMILSLIFVAILVFLAIYFRDTAFVSAILDAIGG